ncbi:hypothetical protein PENSPDRAFT_273276 [Peniophora sp. CONT]|nr:hypothetical protein PENSPDRAFT_273276 [Peniophora sp. CONT]
MEEKNCGGRATLARCAVCFVPSSLYRGTGSHRYPHSPTAMSVSYQKLAQSEDGLPSPTVSTAGESSLARRMRLLALALLALNVLLALANGAMTLRNGAALHRVLPAFDVHTLPMPDQYQGLPAHSRNKTTVLRDENGNLVYPSKENAQRRDFLTDVLGR